MKKTKHNVKNLYVLSPMQAGMLFHHLKDPHGQAYVQQIAWRIEGDLDIACFEAAWNELIRRHDILRTVFAWRNVEEPLQVVLEERRLAVAVHDIAHLKGEAQQAFGDEFKMRERARPFVLDREPLLRLHVLVQGPRLCEAVLTHHHIIMDGWSLGNLVKESLDIYRALLAGAVPPPGAARPYRDYLRWLGGRDESAAQAFWKDYLADYETPATPPQAGAGAGAPCGIHLDLDEDLVGRLARLGQAHGATLNTVLQALWGVLLARHANLGDVVFGAVVSGRPGDLPGVENMAGIFINTVPVRVRIGDATTLGELLTDMQHQALRCEPHHYFPLARIQAETPLRDRLLGSLFVMENYPLDEIFEEGEVLPGTAFRVTALETFEQTHFDLGVRFLPDRGMKVKIGYNPARYGAAQMERLAGHLPRAARQFAELGGAAPLAGIDILAPAERRRLLDEFNATALDFPRDRTLAELFAERVAAQPDAPALTFRSTTLSYAEVDRRAQAVAARLRRDFSIRPDERVGLLLARSEWTVIGILAALKAGGAYVPMEASFPDERLRFLVADSGCRALLCDDATAARAAGLGVPVLNVMAVPAREAIGLPPPATRPEHLAYVIYTSGSTGEPKGVMVEQRSVANLVAAMNQALYGRYPRRLNVALITTYVFDGSVQQIFSALLLGHHLFVMDDEIRRDTRRYTAFCLDKRIDVAGCIPNFLALLNEAGELPALKQGLTHMIFGGEPLPRHLLDTLLALPGELTVSNLYGPTECCVNATAFTVSAPGCVATPVAPVGRPLANVEALILDRWGGLAPLGAVGELCIGGAGVARGYLGNDALTREKFIAHPDDPARRIYRSGDLARWLPDGNIEFLGRNDHQVKVAGYRIEVGEIEEALERHPQVREVAVVPVAGVDGRTVLRACLALHGVVDESELRAHLAGSLPHYMIPARFRFLVALPTMVSGKIDRKALMELEDGPDPAEQAKTGTPPRNATEAALVEVWRAVFGRPKLGIDDDYFALGGDSIRAIQILARLHRAGLKLEIKDLFRHPTIAELAPFVGQAEAREAAVLSGEVAQTPIQRRYFAGAPARPEWFNHAVLLRAPGGLDEDAARRALLAVGAQHGAFRLRFRRDAGVWRQEAGDGPTVDFRAVDLRGYPDPAEEIARRADALHQSFDLAAGPLAKALLFRCGDGDRLLWVVHHLIIDGVSWRIVVEDFTAAYRDLGAGRAPDLLPAGDSLQRWGAALERYAASPALLRQLAYWQQVEAAASSPFPPDHARPQNRQRDAIAATLALAPADSEALLGPANRAYGTTTEDLLLVALARALHRWRGIARTLVALEGHGREAVLPDLDVNRTVGWFTSLYPLLLELPSGADAGQQIKRIKEALRGVPDKGFGYGMLRYATPVEAKNGVALSAQPPLRFNYLGQFDAGGREDGFEVSTDGTGQGVDPDAERSVDIDVSALVLGGALEIGVAASRHRYDEASLNEFARLIRAETLALADHCLGRENAELTPSDLSCSDIGLDELEGLFS